MALMKPWFEMPSIELKEQQAIVIGAGMAGAAVARSLADDGWSVTVFDANRVASGASGNRAGILSPESNPLHPSAFFYSEAFKFALQRIPQLAEEQRIAQKPKLNYDWCGSLEFSRRGSPRQESSTTVSASLLQNPPFFETLHEDLIHHPDAGWVSPKELCEVQFQHPLIQIFENAPVEAIQPIDRGWKVTLLEGDECTAPILILANGQAALRFAPCARFPLQSVRGQLTEIPEEIIHHSIKKILCYEGYFIPAIDGVSTLGATFDRDDFDRQIRLSDHQKNLDLLNQRVSGLFKETLISSGSLKGRVGFRSSSLDHLPLIGPVPHHDQFLQDYQDLHHGKPLHQYPSATYWPGLYVSLGHGSRGILSSLMGGAVLSALLNQKPLPLETSLMEMIHPARFLIRQLKKKGPYFFSSHPF